jgi:heme oxygenase
MNSNRTAAGTREGSKLGAEYLLKAITLQTPPEV